MASSGEGQLMGCSACVFPSCSPAGAALQFPQPGGAAGDRVPLSWTPKPSQQMGQLLGGVTPPLHPLTLQFVSEEPPSLANTSHQNS